VSDNALAVAVPAGYRDWRSVASLAIDSVSSPHSKRAYEKALKDFFAWYSAEARPPLSRAIVQQYKSVLESASLAAASINLQLSAIRKLATEAAENDLLDRSVAQGIVSLKGLSQSGARAGNWLSREQARDLLAQPEIGTTEGKRDRAILAVLLGCALRRSELASLECAHIQQRDGRWVFIDLRGKGRRIRTVPIPPFVKVAIDAWTAAAGLSEGPLFRRVRRRKYSEKTPVALSERMIWHIVTKYARQTGLVNKLAPHDMRRTCAKLCRESGGELEQIQFLLGHASIQTTERYLGSRQNLKEAVNDRLGLDE
jgi:site-specific recombinase XerD